MYLCLGSLCVPVFNFHLKKEKYNVCRGAAAAPDSDAFHQMCELLCGTLTPRTKCVSKNNYFNENAALRAAFEDE
jgi:hypothetical protein